MAPRRGPRPEYDEYADGTIRIEIDFELWSNSGREKHIDIAEQGAWMAQDLLHRLRQLNRESDEVNAYEVRYFGNVPATSEPRASYEID